MNLFEIGKEEIYQNTVRVLVYPNITFQEDLEKDSYIQVIKNQIKLLNEIRSDLWFYLILTLKLIHRQCVAILELISYAKCYIVDMILTW
jgi:hypothetical protein